MKIKGKKIEKSSGWGPSSLWALAHRRGWRRASLSWSLAIPDAALGWRIGAHTINLQRVHRRASIFHADFLLGQFSSLFWSLTTRIPRPAWIEENLKEDGRHCCAPLSVLLIHSHAIPFSWCFYVRLWLWSELSHRNRFPNRPTCGKVWKKSQCIQLFSLWNSLIGEI